MRRCPHWDLERVKQLVSEGKLYVQKGRALQMFATRTECLSAATAAIEALTTDDYAETVQLTWDVADVYGVKIYGAGWYLKLYIDESEPDVTVISFHPLERALRTLGGLVQP